MDINLAVCQALIRIVLPAILLTSVVIRQNLFSGIYLAFLLVAPFLPKPSAKSLKGGSLGLYLKLLIFTCFLISGTQFVFQLWLLLSSRGYKDAFGYCTPMGEIFYIIGLNRLDSASFFSILRLFALDYLVFTYSVVVYIISRKVFSKYIKREELAENHIDIKTYEDLRNDGAPVNETDHGDVGRSVSLDCTGDNKPIEQIERRRTRRQRATEIARFVSEICFHLLLCGSAVLNPSITSSFYLILFLIVATWLSSNRKLGVRFERIRFFVCIYAFCQIFILFIYQLDYIGSLVPSSNLYARLFGLTEYHVVLNCTQYREFEWNTNLSVNVCAHPFILIALYFISASIVRRRLFNPDKVLEESKVTKDTRPDTTIDGPKTSLPISSDERKDIRRIKSVHLSPSSYDEGIAELRTSNSDENDERSSLLVGPAMPLREYAPCYDTTPLLSGTQQKNYKALKPRKSSQSVVDKSAIDIDSNGSVIWKNEVMDPGSSVSSPRARMDSSQAMDSSLTPAGKMDKSSRLAPVIYLLNIIKKGSYAGTLIVMMTWSITYHSWLTFVLLLWSCIIWMMANSRQACLKSSPYLVTYAIMLILIQYIFSLNLNDSELPEVFGTINLNEIGIKKYRVKSYQALSAKILFTIMFWITFRQYAEEKERDLMNRRRLASNAEDAASKLSKRPSQRHMSLATINLPPDFSPGLLWLLNVGHRLMVKYWIWIVAVMLMVMSLGRNQVVLYRVVYMFLFLGFVLMFQMSYRLWRNLMYAFWLVVIVYSMVVLIAIYTYQFKNFPQYWEEYLRLSPQMQKDLGLTVYTDPWILFKQLFTPTFFLIITIIQLHFLHKDFLEFSKYEDRSIITMPSEDTRLTPSAMTNSSTAPGSSDQFRDSLIIDLEKEEFSSSLTKPSKDESLKTGETPGRTQISGSTSSFVTPECQPSEAKNVRISEVKLVAAELKDRAQGVWHQAKPGFYWFYETVWRVLEIHVIKLIFTLALVTAIQDITAANFVFVILVVIGLPCPRFYRTVCHALGFVSSAFILIKMLFQLPSFYNFKWEIACNFVHGGGNTSIQCLPFNRTIDNRIYFGLRREANVFEYISDDLLMILVLTLNTVVFIRQSVHRFRTGEECPPHGVVFKDVTRKEADTTVLNCAKYLVNYFFYKFGLETTTVVIVALIAYRMDFVSTILSLCVVLFSLASRRVVSRIWPYFIILMTALLPVEYLLVLGIPPALCSQYPWYELPLVLQRWFYLPSFENPPNSTVILYDFFVLLLACQQWRVFRIESTIDNYSGGDNSEYGTEKFKAHKKQIADFFIFKKAHMDTIKSVVFSGFFWISLAVLFLSATRAYNLFGLGYVLGCFLFLWKGNEFYLKPVNTVIKVWRVLIAYTTLSIFIKSFLEVFGCFYSSELLLHACWLAKLLGISCSTEYDWKLNCVETPVIPNKPSEYNCKVESLITASTSIQRDLICLLVLVIQKRIFGSHYFSYLVKEVKAQQVQASRGAELIHEIQAKEVMEQEQAEREVMEKIKAKVERIRWLQKKGKEARTKTHYQAVRSGDYHMFEDPDSEEIDLEKKPRKSLIPDPVGDELKKIASAKGFTAFCSKLVQGDFSDEEEVEATKVSIESTDVGESSKDSAIVSADRERPLSEQSVITAYTSVPSTAISLPEDVPSTSHAHQEEEPQSESGAVEKQPLLEPPPESFCNKVARYWLIAKYFILSCIISATAQLNEVSRDYRYVSRRLAVEKRALKVLFEIEESEGIEYDTQWKKETLQKISKASVPQAVRAKSSRDSLDKKKSHGLEDKVKSLKKESSLPVDEEDDYGLHANPIVRFIRAIIYAVISQSEFLCYALIIIDQIVNSSLLTLPLPLMVFLWGCLSVPRPSKTFWISVITYTEAIIIAKYIYNFSTPLTTTKSSLWLPLVVGEEPKVELQTTWDLALLLVLFFHRFMLKTLGLWDLESEFKHPKYNPKRESVTNSIASNSKEIGHSPSGLRRRKNKIAPVSTPVPQKMETCEAVVKVDSNSDDNSDLEDAIYHLMEAPSTVPQTIRRLIEPIKVFFNRTLYPPFRISKDAYWAMFFCDFSNFFIVVFNYNAFGSNTSSADITTYFEENRVPSLFLFLLLLQFTLMITDRALYLRKNIKGRLRFHIAIVVLIHVYLFVALPVFSGSKLMLAPKLWYVFKAIYLLLSATQIKSGYPTRILGNCFTKKYSIVNRYLFKAYTLVPFLYDMRLIMDWVWTETSLNLEEWAIMEDMFKQLFERKCDRCFEEKFPEPQGNARRRGPKYFQGWLYLAMIIGAIWFPLVLFALGGTVGKPNRPTSVDIQIEIVGYQKIFKMSATGVNLVEVSDQNWEKLRKAFEKSANEFALLDGYDQGDTTLALLSGNSTSVWGISPPSEQQLIRNLKGNDSVSFKITWYITRNQTRKQAETDAVSYKSQVIKIGNRTVKDELIAMLEKPKDNNSSTDYVTLLNFFPNYLKSVSTSEPSKFLKYPLSQSYSRNVNITLLKASQVGDENSFAQWWQLSDICTEANNPFFNWTEQLSCAYVPLVIFSEKKFPGALGVVSGYGILGLYTTFVFVVSRIIRSLFDNLSFYVMYTQMPYVDRVLQLCLDIYLVRERREFGLEEDLYAKLLFLYRSPETLIKWTKPPAEPIKSPDETEGDGLTS